MIAQNDPRMRPEIQAKGCYLFSLIWWGWYKTGVPLSAELINDDLYWHFLREGWMRTDDEVSCYILNPVAILDYLGVAVSSVRKEGADYATKRDDLLVGQWRARGAISHFVPMWENLQVAFDSWHSSQGGSRAIRDGALISWRVFT